jgi:hypothetical protein
MITAIEARKRSEEVLSSKNKMKQELIEKFTERLKGHMSDAIKEACDKGEFCINVQPIIQKSCCDNWPSYNNNIDDILRTFQASPYEYSFDNSRRTLSW